MLSNFWELPCDRRLPIRMPQDLEAVQRINFFHSVTGSLAQDPGSRAHTAIKLHDGKA